MLDVEMNSYKKINPAPFYQWLTEQGLVSVKEQWVKTHYPASAR
jgi:hypothetical protein